MDVYSNRNFLSRPILKLLSEASLFPQYNTVHFCSIVLLYLNKKVLRNDNDETLSCCLISSDGRVELKGL